MKTVSKFSGASELYHNSAVLAKLDARQIWHGSCPEETAGTSGVVAPSRGLARCAAAHQQMALSSRLLVEQPALRPAGTGNGDRKRHNMP
ncbi:hypothetical protein EYF80_018004 [Liparis tanakae]|uniref:Uncharacterized protein n=1 Tax=Liparis tanakae TaxID=230148 RepID=A0A4Z2I3L9_9TELE|nr:hypothetical protein EYF80_018004 [Liparis tanakae]